MAFENAMPAALPMTAGGPALNALKSIYEAQQAGQNAFLTGQQAQGQNIENQFMPDKLRLANQYQGLVNQMYVPQTQASINSTNALTNKTKTMTPLEAANQKNINDWYAREEQSKINQQNAMTHYYNMGGAGMGVGGKEELMFQNLVSKDNPQLNNDPNKVYEASQVMRQGGAQLSDGTPLNPMSPAARASYDRIIKGSTNSQGLNQQRSAAVLDTLLNRADSLMPNASKFAGLAGKANKTVDAFAASLGKDDPTYRDFQIFTTQIVPQLANQMILTEGARANNTQKTMMMRVADPTFWNSNPALAMKEWKYLRDTFKDVTSTISKSPSQVQQGLSSGNQSGAGQPTLRYNPANGELEPI